MSDQTDEQKPDENEPADESADTPPEGEPTPDPKPDDQKLSYDDLEREVEKVRREAAGYRTRLRDAEQKLSDAKTPEEVEAAVAELRSRNAELERSILVSSVASKHRLPAELAAVLQGATEAELEAHAAQLAKFVPSDDDTPPPPPHLVGGLAPGSGDPDEGLDPRALAKKHALKRR